MQLYGDSNDGVKNEKESSTTDKLPEPIGEESLQSSKEYEKEEETPENQVPKIHFLNLLSTSL